MLPAKLLEQQLSRLKRTISRAEYFGEAASRPLGVAAIDAALGGGLAGGALHELKAATALHVGATAGFALALAALARAPQKEPLWIATDFGVLETGVLYGPGLDQFGLAV